jgi:class 3 adenylate cyclase
VRLLSATRPQAHEHDAERAVRAGLSLVEAVPNAELPLQVRVGIAAGLVVVGDLIGAGAAQEQAVVGETPNLAARLQALAGPGAVVIASSTGRMASGIFEYRDLGTVSLKRASPSRCQLGRRLVLALPRFEGSGSIQSFWLTADK